MNPVEIRIQKLLLDETKARESADDIEASLDSIPGIDEVLHGTSGSVRDFFTGSIGDMRRMADYLKTRRKRLERMLVDLPGDGEKPPH